MTRKTHRRLVGVVAASAALHLAVLGVLAVHQPQVLAPPTPPPLFEVTIAPLYLVEPKVRSRQPERQAPSPLRPRRNRASAGPLPVAPLYVPPADGPAGVAPHPTVQPAAPNAGIGRALRLGGVGCDTPGLVGLTPAERDRCAERLGANARTAAYLGQGLSRGKQGLLDGAAASKEAYRQYRDAPMPPGLSGSDAAGGLTGLGQSRPTTDHRF